MRLPRGAPLNIALAFDIARPRVPVARLAMSEGLGQLEWSREIIASGINPAALYYPPEPGLQAARTRNFNGLHGFLADALPEGWGHLEALLETLCLKAVDLGDV